MAAFLGLSSVSLRDGRKLSLRGVLPEDAASFLAFRKQVPHESNHTMQYVGMSFPSPEETTAKLKAQLEDRTTLNLGVFDAESRLVGHLNFRVPFAEHPWAQHVGQFGMMVLREYWGQGMGRHLLEAQDLHARRLGVRRIEATVRVNNERGLRLYEQNGYVVEGRRRQAARVEGIFEDEYFIAKIFEETGASWNPPTLETERLKLRPLRQEDAADIFAYAHNPNVSKYTAWEPHASIQDSERYLREYVFEHYSNQEPEALGITLKENPERVIGTVGCFWVSKNDRAMELAYALAEEQWGRGLAAEAARAVMAYCFSSFSLQRIQARCKADNRPSARVMEKLGMQYEGTLRSSLFHRGRFWDMHSYATVKT